MSVEEDIVNHNHMGLDCSKSEGVTNPSAYLDVQHVQQIALIDEDKTQQVAHGLTPEMAAAVQRSWVLIKVNQNLDDVGEVFFSKLYELHPEIEPMFPNPPRVQGRMIITFMEMGVSSLKDFSKLEKNIKLVAKRHDQYGARPEYYDMLLPPLMDTLHETLEGIGEELTADTREGWTLVYKGLCQKMIETQQQQ